MKKIKVTIEYDGSAYSGWQYQTNGVSIQEIFEKALHKITKAKTSVSASGRTDSGVHAEAQVAHFSTNSKMTGLQLLRALNSILPGDIVVKQVEEVPVEFDARYWAVRKIYRYTILNRDYPSALHRGRVWFIPHSLDLAAMKRAGKYLLGEHDFSAFRASNSNSKNAVRKLFRLDFKKDQDFIHMTFEGSGFLKYMVRNIVGTLVKVGQGQMRAKQVQDVLNSRDRKQAGPTAPPHGLCLVKVIYGDGENRGK